MHVDVPGFGNFDLQHLVLDYNGTLAKDGKIAPAVLEKLRTLSEVLTIHILTADTFGTVLPELSPLKGYIDITVLRSGDHTEEKGRIVEKLGSKRSIAVGNGSNDAEMLKHAAVGIAVINEEGCSLLAMQSADILCRGIEEALELVFHPKRLIATLRR